MANNRMDMIRQGLRAGFPIVLGYIPVAITFGVLASQIGMSLTELTLMSLLVYAGASQFMGVNMVAAQATAMEIIVATFVLNFRHFVMSFSLANELRETMPFQGRFLLSLWLTDESFAVASFEREKAYEKHSAYFYFTVFISAYLSWVIGSLVGGLIGEVIPPQLSQSMGIALYAMFIGLLIPAVKIKKQLIFIAVLAMLINLLASQFFSSGWAIVIGTIFGGLSGVYILKEQDE